MQYIFLAMLLFLASTAEAKLYIDITSPQRQMPIAVHEFTESSGKAGKELSDIISDDLGFTGLFSIIDKNAYIESPDADFNPLNWTVLGAEAVVKGKMSPEGDKLIADIYLYDVFEAKALLSKKYRADKSGLRQLAHAIANDIYKQITGEQGVFRSSIAYVAQVEGKHELFLIDWDGGRPRALGITGTVLLRPRWSDDGSLLVYSAERKRQWGIYLLDFSKMKERLVFSSGGTDIAGSFFPGGREFTLSSSKAGTPDIHSFNIEESRAIALTTDKGIEVSPAVSPDGSSIAFVSDKGGSPQIYIMERVGYNKNRITFEGSYNTSPSWSPKGDLLAFSGRREGRNQIFVIGPDGSGLRMLTDKGNNEDPSFSPDGRFIVFASDRDGIKGVYIMRADGEAQRKVSPAGVKAYAPSWAPK